jgi:endogenous inhibitor of DNA gyrase (YacG/DUF329 family)
MVKCAWCGEAVLVKPQGPIPMYCSRLHCQRAYEKRRAERIAAERAGKVVADGRPKTVKCAWCGKVVPVAQKGPLRMYCSRAHGQLAYWKRRSERIDSEIAEREATKEADLEASRAEARSLRRVLRFYADPSNYVAPPRRSRSSRKKSGSAVEQDGGRRAAEALRQVRKSG